MTLAEMQTYFQLLVAETTTSSDFVSSAQMIDLINQGCELFAWETKCIRPTTPISCTLATGTAAYNLSTDFLAVVNGVWHYDGTDLIGELTPIEGGYRTIVENESSNGQPSEYAIFGYSKASASTAPTPQIVIDPPPSVTYNGDYVKVYYAKQALALSASTDVSDIPTVFHRGPVTMAVALMKERDQEFDQAKFYWQKAQQYVDMAKRYIRSSDGLVYEWRFSEGSYVNR